MSAKEMFEELGYRLISGDDKELINYRIDLDANSFEQIVFNNESKSFWCGRTKNTYIDSYLRKDNNFILIDVKLYKAINQQCKELGWLDE